MKKDLEIFVDDTVKRFTEQLKGSEFTDTLSAADIFVTVDKDFMSKYNLTDKIEFVIRLAMERSHVIYLYDGMELKPDCYYIRPKGYQQVSTLEMLHEAIKQDTYAPDIKHLELPVHV